METKNATRRLEKARRPVRMTNAKYVEPIRLCGGLPLWWGDNIHVKTLRKKRNLIDITIVEGTENSV